MNLILQNIMMYVLCQVYSQLYTFWLYQSRVDELMYFKVFL